MLYSRLKQAERLAYYYDGHRDGCPHETGWWLIDDLSTQCVGFPVQMTFKFISIDRTIYTFPLHLKNYVETISGSTGVKEGSWSFDVDSEHIGDRPFAPASKKGTKKGKDKRAKREAAAQARERKRERGTAEVAREPEAEAKDAEGAEDAKDAEELVAETREIQPTQPTQPTDPQEALGPGRRQTVRPIRYRNESMGTSSSAAAAAATKTTKTRAAAAPSAAAAAAAASPLASFATTATAAATATATTATATATAATAATADQRDEQLAQIMHLFQQQSATAAATAAAAAGPSNQASQPAMAELLAALIQQQKQQQKQLDILVSLQVERAQQSLDQRVSERRTQETTLQLLMDSQKRRPPSATNNSSHRTCCVYQASKEMCKGVTQAEAPRGCYLSIVSINAARDKPESVPALVFTKSNNPRKPGKLGYVLNPSSDLEKNVMCSACIPARLYLPVDTSNVQFSCVMCKAIGGYGKQSWSMQHVLCGDCHLDATELRIKSVLHRVVDMLNKVTDTYPGKSAASFFVEPHNECKAGEYLIDCVVHMRCGGSGVIVAIELDANEHRDAAYSNEHDRNHRVMTALANKHGDDHRILLIRFNPNSSFKVVGDKGRIETLDAERMDRLLVLQTWLLAALLDTHLFPKLGVLYLFYGCDNPRIWRPEDEFNVGARGRSKVAVGVTHRAVMPGAANRASTPWWRYLPDPIVPFQLTKHYNVNHPLQEERCTKLDSVFLPA